jgi:hypothetical protein
MGPPGPCHSRRAPRPRPSSRTTWPRCWRRRARWGAACPGTWSGTSPGTWRVRSAGARLRAGALRELQGRVSRRLLVQGTRGVSLLQREASACDGSAPGGAGAAACALPAVDAVLSASGALGAAQDVGLLSDVLTRCGCWRKEGPCPRKGPRTRCRRTRRIPCNSDCAGRRWTCGLLPESSPGAPSWRASPCTPIRTCMPMTGRDWSGYAATGHAVRWRWNVCHEQRTTASPTA